MVAALKMVKLTLEVLAKKKSIFREKSISLYLNSPLHPKYANTTTTTRAMLGDAT